MDFIITGAVIQPCSRRKSVPGSTTQIPYSILFTFLLELQTALAVTQILVFSFSSPCRAMAASSLAEVLGLANGHGANFPQSSLYGPFVWIYGQNTVDNTEMF